VEEVDLYAEGQLKGELQTHSCLYNLGT